MGNNGNRPLVVVTVFSSEDRQRLYNDTIAIELNPYGPPIYHVAEAYEIILEAAQDRGIHLELNIQPSDSPSIKWDHMMQLSIGVDIEMRRCLDIDYSITLSARYIALHMTSDEDSDETFGIVAARFPDVDDLHLVLEEGENERHPPDLGLKLASFEHLSSLTLQVQLLDDMDLTMLGSLRMFTIC